LLIEDNRFLREGITDILRTRGKFVVDARADGGQLSDVTPPDVVLLDLGLEKEHSLELMAVLAERFPQARVIAMDIIPDQSEIVEFVQAGGAGFIVKNAPVEDYVSTIKAVAGGATILPETLTESLFTQIVESMLKKGHTIPDHATQLTKREREVVALISEGMSNKEIAQQLHLATFTVKSHVHNVLEKLDLNTRLQVAVYARDGRET
jgi:two-component system nitrate/nitrite response regulator NarL